MRESAAISGGRRNTFISTLMNAIAATPQPSAKQATATHIFRSRPRTMVRASGFKLPAQRSATSIMIWVDVPVMIVDGGKADRWTRFAAFWIAIAATRVMPVTRAVGASPFAKGPQVMANAAAELNRRILR